LAAAEIPLNASLLEGCADSICAGGCVAGTDRDFFCGAVAVAVMVDTVAYIAGDTLDVTLIAVIVSAGFKRIEKTHL
jgi:hypothetical protein